MLSKTSVLLKERARRIAAMPRHDLKNGMRNSFYADKQRTTLSNKKKSMMPCKKHSRNTQTYLKTPSAV
jgi:hypothetical protein